MSNNIIIDWCRNANKTSELNLSISAASNGVLRQIFSSRPSAGNYCLNAASRGELDPKRLNNIQKDDLEYFTKFIYLWMSFNNFYNNQYKNPGDKSKVIDGFAQNSKYIEIFKPIVNNNREFGDFRGYILHKKHDHKGYIVNVKNDTKVKYETLGNLTEYMGCIYQIRCNLFHGNKSTENGQDKELVKHAYLSLHKLLTELDKKH